MGVPGFRGASKAAVMVAGKPHPANATQSASPVMTLVMRMVRPDPPPLAIIGLWRAKQNGRRIQDPPPASNPSGMRRAQSMQSVVCQNHVKIATMFKPAKIDRMIDCMG